MLFAVVLLVFSFSSLVNSRLQLNLYLTDWTNENEHFQHDCLHVPASFKEEFHHQIISYCISGAFPSKFKLQENTRDPKFTFEQLSKEKITSEQLYLWSAPIDLIEEYQFYLNQLQHSEKTSAEIRYFYNCTLPYFGPQCQYVLRIGTSNHSSLSEMIHHYYQYNQYQPTLLTCYIHLTCIRGPSPSCLDWTEICDGKVDCLDDGYDEEQCLQLEIHQCNEDEYLCSHGQCIPQSFEHDQFPDCLDQSDEIRVPSYTYDRNTHPIAEPTFRSEDILCSRLTQKSLYLSSLTSSCVENRTNLLTQAIFSIKPNSISNECWTAMKWTIGLPIPYNQISGKLCDYTRCKELINKMCPDVIPASAVPFFFGHVYLTFEKNRSFKQYGRLRSQPTYFCYNDQLLYIPNENKTIRLPNNSTCRLYVDVKDSIFDDRTSEWMRLYIDRWYAWLQRRTLPIDEKSQSLNHSAMYKCLNWSKSISKRRLFDNVPDCYYADDETILQMNKTCSTVPNRNYFKCQTSNECIPRKLVNDGYCQCTLDETNRCDDEHFDYSYAKHTVSFQAMCDGYTHLIPQIVDDQNETDEIHCEEWPLIHIYNRCDGFWHNLDGSDEMNCYLPSLLNCSANHHICVSPKTNDLMCLPIEKANDGIVDCLGAADEPKLCRSYSLYESNARPFYCSPAGGSDDCGEARYICDYDQACENNDDEQACQNQDFKGVSDYKGICTTNYELHGSDAIKVLCRHFSFTGLRHRIYFTLDQQQDLLSRNLKGEITLPSPSIEDEIQSYQQRCHRGLDLEVWLDKTQNRTTNICLCPPSYYGETCQYQNQRVSVTLQFRVTSDSVYIPFTIIISLIDHADERIIHSSEQLTYLSLKDCQKKYYIYLLYSTRPKDPMKIYSIQIDIYEKAALDYRASFIKTLNYTFLPVHRVALQIDIPHINEDCFDVQCINGKCRKYTNDPINQTFCQCKRGWSGQFCTISYKSMCSDDSLSLGRLANNRSLCVCLPTKMGPRCLINDPICQNNQTITCFNKGQCIPIDEFGTSVKNFLCICPKEFTGDQCEISRTKLIITFDQNLTLPSSILIHFIETKLDASPIRTTTFKTTSYGQSSVTVFWSLPFHIVFVEISKETYYLAHLQKIYQHSTTIETSLNSSDRCFDVKELFNESRSNYSLLRRMKYYHSSCQRKSLALKCFFDEVHLCLCQDLNQQRVANCLDFNHQMNFNCSGQSSCENQGRCFQEQTTCPRISVCQCPDCYYGTRCQFSTNAFSLSLDAILGYHIQPDLSISHQPSAVLISLILTVIITILGLTNGVLSLITFKNKTTRESGCGLYLLSSSVIILFTMIIFLLKFTVLLLSQMDIITNRIFLKIQCYSVDFLLRVCLTIDQWLTAFVAIERAFVIVKGVYFNKKKSQTTAKYTIIGLVLLIMISNIHDPIYRKLFLEDNNDDETRLWCIVNYPSVIRMINSILHILHFLLPFLINFICALIIIMVSTRQQAAIKKKQNYQDIRREQFQQHKNLLIGPCVLLLLAIPRLIISFTSGCMTSVSDAWLFLLGYFISLIPSLLTFMLFVLPSTTYKQAFRKAISQYRKLFNRQS